MSSTMDRREHSRRGSLDRSGSPMRDHHSPRRRSSPRKERSPVHRKISPVSRSPRRTTASHRMKSPAREKIPGRDRSPRRTRPRSPLKNGSPGSPSPPTRRLRRTQAGREEEKVVDRDQRDKGRHKERGEGRDVPSERRLVRDGNDGGSSRSARRGRPVSPEERSPRRRYSSRSPPIENLLPDSPEDLYKGTTKRMKISREITDANEDGDLDSVTKMKAAEEALEAKKQKPSFELSGKLAEETNRVRGITLLFTEPPDARKPDVRWRLYVFKAGEVLNEPLYVHRQSCYLFGRERRVADIPTDHPSCSKQHAVIQFRLVEKEQSDGLLSKQVRPYVMDLGSTNGTFVNDNRIEPQCYYELFERDTVRFGNSSREYVLLHENSAE